MERIDMLKIRSRLPRRLRWGIIGLGKFSETAIIPALLNVRKAKLVSVYSSNAARAKAIADKFSIQNSFSDLQEFLGSDIDAVYVGSANSDHYAQVLAAAEAGKHVFCDKPLALTADEADKMVAACKAHNVQLAVNYVYRFHPLIEKTRELIENQTIGKLLSVSANFNINFPPDDNFRFHKAQSGGGVMRDLGTHMIDTLRFLNGEVEPVACVMDNLLYRMEVEDFASAMLRFTNGGYATFCVSSNASRAFNRLEILGTKGSIHIENLIGGRFSSAKMTIILEGERKIAFRKRTNRLHRIVKDVTNAFSKGIPASVTGEDGAINMRIMEQLEAYAAQK